MQMFYMIFVGGGSLDVHSYQTHQTKLLKSVHFIVWELYLNFKFWKI